jgi:predicted nuclease of restriction endonuclease-like (RecB) superfamily
MNAGWSVRELKRQIETLYERLLLSFGTENKERVLELALNGNEITKLGGYNKRSLSNG